MASGQGQDIFRRWVGEYCAPVVVTTASAEAEKICLRNGMLLHELLSCFGHLDGINTNIRIPNQVFPMHDAHIRFERMTEAKPKTADSMEQLLLNKFTPYDVAILPNTAAELKANPPNAWTSNIEQIVMRGLSFSEYEMVSQPVVLLTVVATSDADPLAAMLELASLHHTPACLSNGQYDPNVQRVYLLLDDIGEKVREPFSVLRQLHSRFPPSCTKLIGINSFTADNLNVQQPDMWSKFIIPKFFPEQAPQQSDGTNLPRDQHRGQPVLGCRLSVEDFMKLREFCIWLYNEQVVPALERRLIVLGKQVNDSRRGVKNVLKSFWRKPRDETEHLKGALKYRYDKIETQTLLLADTAFMVRDYDTAAANYKLVREDYRADKSNLHLGYTLLMIAVCQALSDPQKVRDTHSYLDVMCQCLVPGEMPHGAATLALLAAELYSAGTYGRAPLESARVLLQAVQLVVKYPLLSGLLVERAGLFMLQGFQVRRYVFHSILASNKLHRCGAAPAKHAMACFAAASLVLEKGGWGDMKAKLARALSADLKTAGPEGRQRALMLLLKVLASIVGEATGDVLGQASALDAVSVLNEISRDGGWGNIRVNEGWSMCPTRDVLLGPLPIGDLAAEDSAGLGRCRTEVCGLPVPELDTDSLMVLEPVNGSDQAMLRRASNEMLREIELMRRLLEAEREVCGHCGSSAAERPELLARHLAKIQREFDLRGHHNPHAHGQNHHRHRAHHETTRIPLGEKLFLKMHMRNKLPVDLSLSDIRLGVDRSDLFDICGQKLTLPAEESAEVLLEAAPSQLGSFKVVNASWNLSEHLAVKQTLSTKGPLLQRTLKQRAHRERAEDQRLHFEVVPAEPLLRLTFEGLSPEALQGQLMRSKLRIRNEGAAAARDVFIKCNRPWFLFFRVADGVAEGAPMDYFGCSSTVVHLGGTVILPGEEIQLDAWLRLSAAGVQHISLLAACAERPECKVRTSFLSVQINSLPCAKLSVQLVPKMSSALHYTMVAELTNLFKAGLPGGDPLGAVLPRESSLGLLDRPNMDERHAVVDEMGVKIVGLRLLGGAQVGSTASVRASCGESSEYKYLTSPGERVVDCFPLKFLSPRQQRRGSSVWVVPMAAPEHDEFARVAGRGAELHALLERFQTLWYSVDSFADQLTEAAIALEMAELEADAMGPRSIQDVRRQRQKNQDDDDVSDTDGGGETPLSESGSAKSSAGAQRPGITCAQDIADKEAARNALSVGVIWVCRWRNKLRWGLHHLPQVGYSSAAQAKLPAPVASALGVAGVGSGTGSSALQFALVHVPRVALDENVRDVAVSLIVRSFVDQPVVLAVRVKMPNEKPLPARGLGTKGADHGLAWINQVSYHQLDLQAFGEVKLDFCVQVLARGVHNVNRFQVCIGGEDEAFEDLMGQSLLRVA